jgi:AraC-like DNA-binding protein
MPPEFPSADTFLARRALRFIAYGEEHGLSRREMVRVAGLDQEQLSSPDRRISAGVIWSLCGLLEERLGDPDVGLRIGERARLEKGGSLIGYSVTHSRYLGHALGRLVRYTRLVAGASKLSLEPVSEGVRLASVEASVVQMLRVAVDDGLAAVITAARQISGREIVPVRVEFPYPRPANARVHREFFRCRVSFEHRRSAIVFRRADLRVPLIAADETLSGYLDRLADQELAKLHEPETLGERVRRVVWRDLADGSPSLAAVASELGVGMRTLQRRLREEGTSYAAVVEDVRRTMAGALLRRPELAIYEIAYMLGYAEPSTFYRAFRRWHGRSPEEARQLLA